VLIKISWNKQMPVPLPQRQPDVPDLTGLTILAVDDDDTALQVVRMLLTGCGATVLFARTTSAAVAYLSRATKIDVLISDLSMPDIDGVHLIQRVRRHPLRHRLPAIALSGSWTTTQMIAEGFYMFVPKPVDLDQLAAAIRSVITIRRG
jgi:CheY-like chemotaxis protein